MDAFLGQCGLGRELHEAAHDALDRAGQVMRIMGFGLPDQPVQPKRLLMNERNEIVNATVL